MADEISTGVKLLLVEDDLDFRSSLAGRLEKRGFIVVETASAEEALGMLERATFDVVVSDIKLPGTDGMELLAEIKRRDALLPVILITGYASLESAKEAVTLHDNREDPYQLMNVAEDRPKVVKRIMEEELVPWLKKTRDPWLGG